MSRMRVTKCVECASLSHLLPKGTLSFVFLYVGRCTVPPLLLILCCPQYKKGLLKPGKSESEAHKTMTFLRYLILITFQKDGGAHKAAAGDTTKTTCTEILNFCNLRK